MYSSRVFGAWSSSKASSAACSIVYACGTQRPLQLTAPTEPRRPDNRGSTDNHTGRRVTYLAPISRDVRVHRITVFERELIHLHSIELTLSAAKAALHTLHACPPGLCAVPLSVPAHESSMRAFVRSHLLTTVVVRRPLRRRPELHRLLRSFHEYAATRARPPIHHATLIVSQAAQLASHRCDPASRMDGTLTYRSSFRRRFWTLKRSRPYTTSDIITSTPYCGHAQPHRH